MVLINWRRTVNQTELTGYDFSENPLTAFSQPKRKPGRPQSISDETLQRTRNELLYALEENWALIGWELQQAETPSDIRAALRRIEGINCPSLELFCLEYRRETNFSELQATRKRFQEASGKLREAHSNWTQCKEPAELAQSLLSKISDAQQREELRTICQETESSLAAASKALLQVRARSTQLERAVLQREASFAQSELLEFIQSDRYESTPLTFANAMAGLPAIRWRQSMDRCLSLEVGASCGYTYARFLIVGAALNHPAVNAEEAIERMKARLLQAKGQDVFPCNALAENWYFLRCAIESVFAAPGPAERAIPYRIFAEYQRRFSIQSALEILAARREILSTPAYIKERHRIGTQS